MNREEQISGVILALVLIAVCQFIMHSVITQNSLKFLDNTFGCRWFGSDAWRNKHEWTIAGKKMFVYFPFIAVTDVFHLAHFLMGVGLGATIAFAVGGGPLLTLCLVVSCSGLYSAVFELLYSSAGRP